MGHSLLLRITVSTILGFVLLTKLTHAVDDVGCTITSDVDKNIQMEGIPHGSKYPDDTYILVRHPLTKDGIKVTGCAAFPNTLKLKHNCNTGYNSVCCWATNNLGFKFYDSRTKSNCE